MKAIILAAGRGSRMKDLTNDRPKCLIELKGKSLLQRQLEALKAAGVKDIGIITGYKREMLADKAEFEFHNPRWQETNMVTSLAAAEEWLKSSPCIVSYSDIFYAPEAVTSLMESDADIAVTYDPNWLEIWGKRFEDPLSDAETFRLNPDHSLAEIGNTPKSVEEVEGQYMGLLRFTPVGWADVIRLLDAMYGQERDKMHMTGTLQKVIEAGKIKIQAIPYSADWGEVDSSEDLAAYS